MGVQLSWQQGWIIPVVFGVFYLLNVIFNIIGGEWLTLLFSHPPILIYSEILWTGFGRDG